MATVRLVNVNKVYDGGVHAVHDFSIDIKDKEFIVFVGPSGCGKSTTLRMIAGLEEISYGELYIDDKLVNSTAPKDRDIAMVFQSYALYPQMTVYNNMAYALKLRKVPKDEIDRRVKEAAKILRLTDYLDRKPRALSGGQRQRVALGRSIVRRPKVFLMDEPLSNLDAKLRVAMRSEIVRIHNEVGATTIYVTHDQIEAMTMGTRIVVMKDGYIQQADTPKEVYDNPANRFVAGFIGSPSMNFFEGKIRPTDKGADFEFTNGLRLEIPENKAFALANEYRNKNVILGVRPEHFFAEVVRKDPKADYTKRTLSGKIVAREMLGAESMFYLEETFAGEFAVRLPVETKGRVGEEMALFVDMDRVHFFDADTEKNIFYRGGQQ